MEHVSQRKHRIRLRIFKSILFRFKYIFSSRPVLITERCRCLTIWFLVYIERFMARDFFTSFLFFFLACTLLFSLWLFASSSLFCGSPFLNPLNMQAHGIHWVWRQRRKVIFFHHEISIKIALNIISTDTVIKNQNQALTYNTRTHISTHSHIHRYVYMKKMCTTNCAAWKKEGWIYLVREVECWFRSSNNNKNNVQRQQQQQDVKLKEEKVLLYTSRVERVWLASLLALKDKRK